MRVSRVTRRIQGLAMKFSYILTGALVASTVMLADWAVAAPLGHSFGMRADHMAPV